MGSVDDLTWLLLCSFLVMLMQAGFLCLETGLTRSKNNINVAVKNLTDLGVSVLVFWFVGHGLMFGLSQGGIFGADNFAPQLGEAAPSEQVIFLFQALFCGTAVTIMSGAVAGRMRFGWYVGGAVLVTALVYPVVGHWIWNDSGWLNELGFVDFAGGTVVHSTGGWAGLAFILVLGPRRGRFDADGDALITGSNVPFATLGALLLWVGWAGFNGGSLLRYDDQVGSIIAHTAIAGSAGLAAGLLLGWARNKRVTVTDPLNGLLAGLVAICGCANLVSTREAVAVGIVGVVVARLVESQLKRRRIDDAIGAVPVHLGAGVWGTIAVALVGSEEAIGTGLSFVSQLGVQVLGVAVAGFWCFGVVWTVARLGNVVTPVRVSAEAEDQGLNISEHGASTDLADLFRTMETHTIGSDMSARVPENPFTEAGQIGAHYNLVIDALTESQSALAMTERVASTDALTQTLNRRGLTTTLAGMSGAPKTVCMLDIRRFGSVNDSFGYSVGDEVLIQVSGQLRARLGSNWKLGRWGGDEFVAIALGNVSVEPDMLERIECPLSAGGQVWVESVAGLVHAEGVVGPEEIIERATYALEEAKRSERPLVHFDSVLQGRYLRARQVARTLETASFADRIVPYGQTIMKDGVPTGIELLARWRNDDDTLAAPDQFLPVVVECGRMADMDLHMIDVGIAFIAENDGEGDPWVAVNVSAPSLAVPGFIDRVDERLVLSGIFPGRLVIEITETEQVEGSEGWFQHANQLRELGVGLAIDDFGTGYSSIERMTSLPVTHIKFDRSLVLVADGPMADVIRSLVRFATLSGVSTVAEGIETSEEHHVMSELGVEMMQGFLFSRPMPLDGIGLPTSHGCELS